MVLDKASPELFCNLCKTLFIKGKCTQVWSSLLIWHTNRLFKIFCYFFYGWNFTSQVLENNLMSFILRFNGQKLQDWVWKKKNKKIIIKWCHILTWLDEKKERREETTKKQRTTFANKSLGFSILIGKKNWVWSDYGQTNLIWHRSTYLFTINFMNKNT